MSGPTFELKSRLIKAGAGAGKTKTLIDAILKNALTYYYFEKRFPRIVVTTFTRKATQEIRERLLKKALDPDLKVSLDLDFDFNQDQLLMFVTSHSFVHISTIHGVLFKFLSRYGHLSGLGPHLKIQGGSVHRHTLKKIISETLENTYHDQQFLQFFNFESLAEMVQVFYEGACFHDELKRYSESDLIEHARRFQGSLVFKTSKLLDPIDFFKTPSLQKFYEKLQVINQWGTTQNFTDFRRLVLDFLQGVRKPVFSKETSAEFLSVFNETWEDLKSLATPSYDPAEWQNFERISSQLESFFKVVSLAFEAHKLRTGVLSLQDLEYLSLKILKTNAELGARFAQDYDYWMIDEFQDTSPVQVQLLSFLKGQQPSFIVGDPQQSIYLFRGARSEVFAHQESLSKNEGVELEFLETNYRSDPALLLFFNSFFKKLSPQFRPMIPFYRDDEKKNDSKAVASIYTFEKCHEDESEESEADREARAAIGHIQRLRSQGVLLSSICVLARKNATLLTLSRWLNEFRIPYHLNSSSRFFERREVKDVIHLLKFLINPHDDLNLLSLLRSPWFLVSDQDLLSFKAKAGRDSLWSLFVQSETLPDPVAALLTISEDCKEKGLSLCIEHVLRQRVFGFAYVKDPSGQWEGNLWKCLELVRIWESQRDFDLLDFIHETAEIVETDSQGESEVPPVFATERLEMMTVHGSKGLQFDHVLVLDQGDGARGFFSDPLLIDESTGQWTLTGSFSQQGEIFKTPLFESIKQEYKERERAESERVLYVAMTRARKTISLILPEDYDKESWAAAYPLQRTEGFVEGDEFSYEVSKAILNPSDFALPEFEFSEEPDLTVLEPLTFSKVSTPLISVTEVVGHSAEKSLEKIQPSAVDIHSYARLKKITLGNKVHEFLQRLKHMSEFEFLDFSHFAKSEDEKYLRQSLHYLMGLQKPPFKDLLKSGFAEWGFTVPLHGKILQGQIDLWGFDSQGELWIIDYKTGNPENHKVALDQLNLYAQALQTCGYKSARATHLAALYPIDELAFVIEV